MKKTSCITTIALVAAFTHASISAIRAEEGVTKTGDRAAKFAKRDMDKNGSLSKEEFLAKAKYPAKAEKAFARKDANNDGYLSLEEFSATGARKKKSESVE